jgi:pSer/pThr/pTyr-binding forkhead associated (FHA) protein
MPLATSLDNANLLRALEVFLVALIWLFFFRVIRAVWVEVRPPRPRLARRQPNTQAATQAPHPRSRQKGPNLRLRVVEPEAARGQVFEIPDEVTIGRAVGCGVRMDDAYTSNIHARLYRRDGSIWVEDLGSTNGTWLNAERVASPKKLGRGDILQIGGTVFEVAR